ncbi:NERD domain-containing protein [Lysinibacillus yapensis]|uniref:NERD domain-containing protein n=1 Tax=Ureibacillus yapensis TaxID=2304605 RepID=A0A396SGD5_9BACL|nr:nuclease-related domain-containing protein [Lysinibacillus yapensis]RHW40112.1 NERD domain-containing protein [Lysinibacillus yapensis]
MIKWKRNEPDTIPLLECILRRLCGDDPLYSQYEEKLKREKAGFYGEQRLDREWLDFQIQCPFVLLNGLRFENKDAFTHQIDALFLCPYFIFVMEVKNIAGRIDINDETNQCIRTRADGRMEGFTNPVDQVRRHGGFVREFLRELGIAIPVVSGVVFANPYSIIGEVNARDVLVFQVSGLRYKMGKLFARYKERIIEDTEMHSIAEELIRKRRLGSSWQPKIDSQRLKRGVLCPGCNHGVQMHYKYGSWHCSRCGNNDESAFYEALNDYRLLWGERLTNGEFREFFGIESRKTAYRILNSLDLKCEGERRYKNYLIPSTISEMSHRK